MRSVLCPASDVLPGGDFADREGESRGKEAIEKEEEVIAGG